MTVPSLPPEIGILNEIEIELLDAAIPSVAMSDTAPLLNALEAILRARVSAEQWQDYQRLPNDEKMAVLRRVAQDIPALAGVGW